MFFRDKFPFEPEFEFQESFFAKSKKINFFPGYFISDPTKALLKKMLIISGELRPDLVEIQKILEKTVEEVKILKDPKKWGPKFAIDFQIQIAEFYGHVGEFLKENVKKEPFPKTISSECACQLALFLKKLEEFKMAELAKKVITQEKILEVSGDLIKSYVQSPDFLSSHMKLKSFIDEKRFLGFEGPQAEKFGKEAENAFQKIKKELSVLNQFKIDGKKSFLFLITYAYLSLCMSMEAAQKYFMEYPVSDFKEFYDDVENFLPQRDIEGSVFFAQETYKKVKLGKII